MTSMRRSIKTSHDRLSRDDKTVFSSAPIESALQRRIDRGRKNLVPYFTAGFPDRQTFISLLRAAEVVGCDVIEVGLPFSDPIADGPVIQNASQEVLDKGMNIAKALEEISAARIEIPIVVMGYLNPILAYGFRRFATDARAVAVAGLIVPDLPFMPRESANGLDFAHLCAPFETVLMAAPTTARSRLAAIGRATRGFLYAVTVTGVTGARRSLPRESIHFLRRARPLTTRPVLAGFGIADPTIAKQVAAHCDGVIVGSALTLQIRNGPRRGAVKRAGAFLKRLREAL